nr:hypothetical protein CFP56_62703 [Quercus suber]
MTAKCSTRALVSAILTKISFVHELHTAAFEIGVPHSFSSGHPQCDDADQGLVHSVARSSGFVFGASLRNGVKSSPIYVYLASHYAYNIRHIIYLCSSPRADSIFLSQPTYCPRRTKEGSLGRMGRIMRSKGAICF